MPSADRQAVIFAGAGISFASLGIAGAGLRDVIGAQIAQDYQGYDPAQRSFEDVCDEYVAINDRTGLVNKIAAQIPKNAPPTPAHVSAVETFRFIVTTNWDLLFEAAYQQIGEGYHVLAHESDAPNFNYDQHNLLKLHGSVDRPLTIVATTDDYESYADTHKQLLDRVGELLHSNTVLSWDTAFVTSTYGACCRGSVGSGARGTVGRTRSGSTTRSARSS